MALEWHSFFTEANHDILTVFQTISGGIQKVYTRAGSHYGPNYARLKANLTGPVYLHFVTNEAVRDRGFAAVYSCWNDTMAPATDAPATMPPMTPAPSTRSPTDAPATATPTDAPATATPTTVPDTAEPTTVPDTAEPTAAPNTTAPDTMVPGVELFPEMCGGIGTRFADDTEANLTYSGMNSETRCWMVQCPWRRAVLRLVNSDIEVKRDYLYVYGFNNETEEGGFDWAATWTGYHVDNMDEVVVNGPALIYFVSDATDVSTFQVEYKCTDATMAPPTMAPPTDAPPTPAPDTMVPAAAFPFEGCTERFLEDEEGWVTNPENFGDEGAMYEPSEHKCWLLSHNETIVLTWANLSTQANEGVVRVFKWANGAFQKVYSVSGEPDLAALSYSGYGDLLVQFTSSASEMRGAGFRFSFDYHNDTMAPDTPSPHSVSPPTPAPFTPFPEGLLPFPGFCTAMMTRHAEASVSITHVPSDNQNECWMIDCANMISLEFTTLETELGYDYMKVYHSDGNYFALYESLTGNKTGTTLLLDGPVLLRYTSDSGFSEQGFTVESTCINVTDVPTGAPPTMAPPTPSPPTPAPETPAPPTPSPPTPSPPTPAPPTPAPPTPAPPTPAPPTPGPPTRAPTAPPPSVAVRRKWCGEDAVCQMFGDTGATCNVDSGRCSCTGEYGSVGSANICVMNGQGAVVSIFVVMTWAVNCDVFSSFFPSLLTQVVRNAFGSSAVSLSHSCGSVAVTATVDGVNAANVQGVDVEGALNDKYLTDSNYADMMSKLGSIGAIELLVLPPCALEGASFTQRDGLGSCTALQCDSGYTLESGKCSEDSSLSTGAVVAIVLGVLLGLILCGALIYGAMKMKERQDYNGSKVQRPSPMA